MDTHVFAPFRVYTDVNLYNCSHDTIEKLQNAFEVLVSRLSSADVNILDPLDLEFDIFSLLLAAVKLCTFNEWLTERNALLGKVFPQLLCSHIVNSRLFQFVGPKIRDGSFQNGLYEMYQSIEASDLKVGILSYSTYLSMTNIDNSGLSSPFVFTLVPSLQISQDLLGHLRETLDDGHELSNDTLFECLKKCISSTSVRATKELMAIMLKNDPELLSRLDDLATRRSLGDSQITDFNASCIEKLFNICVCSLTDNGIFLDERFDSVLLKWSKWNAGEYNRNIEKFSGNNLDSIHNSLVFIMEYVEHGQNLEFLNSKTLLLYYFLSVRLLNLRYKDDKLDVYSLFNKTRCTLSFSHLLINSIHKASIELIKSKKKQFSIPIELSKHFEIFMLPPMAKSNYLVENLEESLESTILNRTQNLKMAVDGLFMTWNILIDTFVHEFQALANSMGNENLAAKILHRMLELFLSALFSSSFFLLNDSINFGNEAFKVIGVSVLQRSLVTFFNIRAEDSDDHPDKTLRVAIFIKYAESLCGESLEFIPIVERLLELIDLHAIFDSALSKTKLHGFVSRHDEAFHRAKEFLSCGTDSKVTVPISTSSTATNTSASTDLSSVEVSMKEFDLYFEEEGKARSGDNNNHSVSSSSSSPFVVNHQAKRNELFSMHRNSLH